MNSRSRWTTWILGVVALVLLAAIITWTVTQPDPNGQGKRESEGGSSSRTEGSTEDQRPAVAEPKPRVQRPYFDWGFVTLEHVGDLNLAENSELEVVREGIVLAKLRVTSVEGQIAAADILPGSLENGNRIRTGDLIR